jgi:GYF domain 2
MGADAIMAGEDAGESWYVRARGRILGPLSWAQLQVLRERGQLARFDQVSRDRQNWTAADSLERLFPRGGSGGAFVAGPGARNPGSKRGPEPESVDFLILGDEDGGGPVTDLGTAGPAAREATGWYYAEAGAPQGPVGYSDLKRLAKDGRIGPASLYWRSGLEQWTSGSDLPELNRLWPFEGASGGESRAATLPPRDRGVEPSGTDQVPRVSPLAIIGLALNLFCVAGNLAAIVVGALALRQVARSNGTLTGKALAVGAIALGLAGLLASALAYAWFSLNQG